MSAHNEKRLRFILGVQECHLRLVHRWQNFFSPQNRPFICYLVMIAIGVWAAGGFWPSHVKLSDWLGAAQSRLLHAGLLSASLSATRSGLWGVGVSLVFVFWLITQPMEMRPNRWWRLGISVVLVYLLLSGMGKPLDLTFAGRGDNLFTFFGFLLPAALLAGMWTPALSWYLTAGLRMLVDSPGAHGSLLSLRPAYRAAQSGQLREALRLVRPILRADFHHYEGLVLAACLHRQLSQRWRTRWTLLRALQKHDLLEAQRERLTAMLGHLEEGGHSCWQVPGMAWY